MRASAPCCTHLHGSSSPHAAHALALLHQHVPPCIHRHPHPLHQDPPGPSPLYMSQNWTLVSANGSASGALNMLRQRQRVGNQRDTVDS